MTCSKSADDALGLSKQDNTNDTCAADEHRAHANETTSVVYADDTGQIIM